MALGGAQGGNTRDNPEQTAEDQSGRDGPAGRTASETVARQDPLADLNGPAATAPVVAARPGQALRQERRSQSFAYDTQAFQGENLTYAILTQPSQGWVTNNGDGTFSFDPGLDFRELKAGETRRISFSYQVSDGWSGTKTESATLTVTGSADGTLTIEATAGNAARRTARPATEIPVASGLGGGLTSEPPAPTPTEPAGKAEKPGFADDLIGSPGAARSGTVTAPTDEAAVSAASEGGTPGDESLLMGSEGRDAAATVPTTADAPPASEETAEPAAREPEAGTWAPLAYDAGADPLMGGVARPETEEAVTLPDLRPGPQAEPEGALAAAQMPADLGYPPEDDASPMEPRADGPEPEPLDPAMKPASEGWRYTILAQPPEGRVAVTDDGGFKFTPGEDFPDLAVGELEQVSFTCEATDREGAKRFVIASLTVTGTSEGPEVCDVTYRQAQGEDASQLTTAGTDHGQSDGTSRGGAARPAADIGDRPAPTPLEPAIGGGIFEGPPENTGAAEPSQDEIPAAFGLGGDEVIDPATGDSAPGAPTPARASPAWQPYVEISATPFAADSQSSVDPPVDAVLAPDSGEAIAADGPEGNRQVDSPAWHDAAEPRSEPRPAPSWQDKRDDVPNAFDTHPAAQPSLDEPAAPDSSEPHGIGGSYDQRQVGSAPWGAVPETPAEAPSSPMWPETLGAESAGDLAPASQPATGHLADGPLPQDGGGAPAMPGLYDEPPSAQPRADIDGDDGQPEGGYRGAVAAEAVTTFLPEDADLEGAASHDTDPKPELAPQDVASEPAASDDIVPAVMDPDTQAADLDSLFGTADSGAPRSSQAPDRSTGQSATPSGLAAGDLPIAESETAPDDGQAAQMSDALADSLGIALAEDDDTAEKSDLNLVTADEDTAGSAELSDFTLSQDTVVEKSETGTMVGQVRVAGADQGSRFIFDLQNDAGGRFDINPRTGKITVAESALLDHAAAASHDIMVQVIAHSGVSCRKTLTINVLPAAAEQAADPPALPSMASGSRESESLDGALRPALLAGDGGDRQEVPVSKAYRPDRTLSGGVMADTLHLDGVTGGPGLGGWALELTAGEVVETNDDNLILSENSSGTVILDGCPVNVAFEGVERIEW